MPDFCNNFMPHGVCLQWNTPLLLTWIIANAGIALAYFAIPAALVYFVKKRKDDLPYPWLFRLFALFIVSCGLTHVMKIWTIYNAHYWAEALLDLVTAIVSLATAILLWPLIPKMLALKSPARLEEANEKLALANKELSTLNKNLILARDQALEASNLKSSFVANISHELRTPVTGVMGMNELLLRTDLTPHQKDLASSIQEAAKSLHLIVNDILDLSKIEAGKMTLQRVLLNPPEMVRESINMLLPAAQKKGLVLNCRIDPELEGHTHNLSGDPARTNQVLLNLMGNAVKFTDRGQIDVDVSILGREQDKTLVKFSVTDTGIGLDEQDKKILFTPFTQADESTTRKYGGTGLGLTISKLLVELMDGEIGVESQKSKGSTFWFIVPFFHTAEIILKRYTASVTFNLGSASQGKVLVVEDNPVLRSLAVKQLETLGIGANAVSNGQAALDELERARYTLILMDCHLPVMDGYEATQKIRELEKNTDEHITIIAMTAGAMTGDYEKCRQAGMDDYLAKPYTLKQLKEKLGDWLLTEKSIPPRDKNDA
ncbi:response regulator [bacterium]|nr:response regulator [bacterium]